jgi:hypothetical protein
MTKKSDGPLNKDTDKALRQVAKTHGFKVRRAPRADEARYDEYVLSHPDFAEKFAPGYHTEPLRAELAILFCKGWPKPWDYIHLHRDELPWPKLPASWFKRN